MSISFIKVNAFTYRGNYAVLRGFQTSTDFPKVMLSKGYDSVKQFNIEQYPRKMPQRSIEACTWFNEL